MQSPNTQSPKQPVLCSHGADVRSGQVRPFNYASLKAFAGWLKNLPAVAEKIDSAYIVGAQFSGHQRTLQTMTGATMIQLDFDKVSSADQRAAVCAVLESLNIGFVAFDSFSNGGKFVVLIPLSRPATAAEHRATMDYIVRELGLYAAGIDPASFNPVLPRFVSRNANSAERTFDMNDAPFIDPVAAADEQSLPSNVASIAPIPEKQANDRFQIYSDQASPEQKALFLVALRHDLIPNRVDDYTRWQPLLYAGFRAWAITSKTLTESQRELLEALTEWSKRSSKYKPGCVEDKLTDWLRERSARSALYIHSILAVEVDQSAMRYAISQEPDAGVLSAAYSAMLGATPVEVIDPAAAAEAQTIRQHELDELEKVRKAGLTVLNRAPHVTPRFVEFLDLVTEIATQGKLLSHADLIAKHPTSWDFFLSPVPVLMSLSQIASMGFMPHTLFRAGKGHASFSLAMWFLHIANQGTGKTEVHKRVLPIIDATVFKHSYQTDKFFSATGMWSKFERSGNVQLLCNDEGESLFGKSGTIDGNLHTLHSASKQLKDQGRPNAVYCPNTQVQRAMQALRAPTLMYNLAGTPSLLKDIPADMWVDGFLGRFTCVYINPADRSHLSRADLVAEFAATMREAVVDDFDALTTKAAAFFNRLWQDSEHPAGREFFTGVDDFGGGRTFDEIVGSIQAHFEQMPRPGMPRAIEICSDDFEIDSFAELFAKCFKRWDAPADSAHARLFGAVQNRAVINLQIFSAVLSLIADPKATSLNYQITEWAEEFLFHSQLGVYEWLKSKSQDTTSSVGVLRFEKERIASLRAAVEPGGLLYTGAVVKGTALRDKYRAWRKLIEELNAPGEAGKQFRTNSEQILIELGVRYERDGRSLTFCLLPQGTH